MVLQVSCKKEVVPKYTILPTDYWYYFNASFDEYRVFHPISKFVTVSASSHYPSSYYQVHAEGNSAYSLILFFNEMPEAGSHEVVDKYSGTTSAQAHVMVFYHDFEWFEWDNALSGEVDVKIDGSGNRRYILKNIITESGDSLTGDLTLN